MGTYFEFIAVPDVTEADAPRKGAELTQWLVREGIICEAINTECAMGDEGQPPGPRYVEAIEEGESRGNLYGVTDQCGLAIITSRHLYHNWVGDFEYSCTLCNARFDDSADEDACRLYKDSILDWHDSGTPGSFACAQCGVERSIVEWQRDGPWVVANLGMKIWDWPLLSKTFIARIERQLGHPIRDIQGKF
ncbi:MAG: hypothetical protein H6818_20125 [Phycisphaerales bacterium]|nr:hypothetical protein [Phycisphaerales bacterium]